MVSVEEGDDVDEPQAVLEDDCEAATVEAIITKTNKKRRRRLFGRGGKARIAAASWWTELKNVETTGCTFVLGYLVLSFVLMTLMFNMREIVGDYCLGSKELKQEQYREGLERAKELRRRSPYSIDEENRFEKELAADLYYDKHGQTAKDSEYFQNHRVPIILREDEDEFELDVDDLLDEENLGVHRQGIHQVAEAVEASTLAEALPEDTA